MNMTGSRSAVSDPALLMRLKTRQLVLLAQLGAERNLGRAAAAMAISQPAATKLLQQLEEALGVVLFKRLARGMEPTAAGEVLVRYAGQLLSDFGFVRDEMRALRSGLRGTLRVGSVPGAVPGLLAPALVRYKERHPRVAISVVVDTSDVMLEQLARGEVDLVLAGLIGDASHTGQLRQFDVIGATAHLAARLCARADAGQLVVTSNVNAVAQVRTPMPQPLEKVSIRGFESPVDCVAFSPETA